MKTHFMLVLSIKKNNIIPDLEKNGNIVVVKTIKPRIKWRVLIISCRVLILYKYKRQELII